MVQRYKFESKSQHNNIDVNMLECCFQWFKGTNLKANHNCVILMLNWFKLFPMVQRYKFESKSQHALRCYACAVCCFQWFKGTNLKANHNLSLS